VQDFRRLKVWYKSHSLTLEVYKATEGFPGNEMYGLTSQIRRACTSISANIAEGCGRQSDADFARLLHIAMGSASEVEYFFLLAKDLGFLSLEDYDHLHKRAVEIMQMLSNLIKKLKNTVNC